MAPFAIEDKYIDTMLNDISNDECQTVDNVESVEFRSGVVGSEYGAYDSIDDQDLLGTAPPNLGLATRLPPDLQDVQDLDRGVDLSFHGDDDDDDDSAEFVDMDSDENDDDDFPRTGAFPPA